MIATVLDRDELGVRSAAGDDEPIRGHRRRGLRLVVQGRRPLRLAVGGVQCPQVLVAAGDVGGRAVGRQRRAGEWATTDGGAGPLPRQQWGLVGAVAQADDGRRLRVGLPQRDHDDPRCRGVRGRGGDGAAGSALCAVGQPALRIGGVDARDEIQRRADHVAAVRVEHEYLPEVRHHQQAVGVKNPRCHRQPDHRLAPPEPLRGRKREDGARLPDIEVVEPVEEWTGQVTALHQPGAPALATPIVGFPHHQRAPARRLAVGGEVAARAQRELRAEAALDRSRPVQAQGLGAVDVGKAAVRGVTVLGGPAGGGVSLDPGVGVGTRAQYEQRGNGGRQSAHGHSSSRHRGSRLARAPAAGGYPRLRGRARRPGNVAAGRSAATGECCGGQERGDRGMLRRAGARRPGNVAAGRSAATGECCGGQERSDRGMLRRAGAQRPGNVAVWLA